MAIKTATIYAGPAGIDMGTFSADCEAAILDAYAREQGYASFEALADALDLDSQTARDELGGTPATCAGAMLAKINDFVTPPATLGRRYA